MLMVKGYVTPTPVQEQSIPQLLAGVDVLGIAQTGTGKTAAFALPILQQLAETSAHGSRKAPIALAIAPTRELAIQIHGDFRDYGAGLGFRQTVIVGGVSQRGQVTSLARGADIVIATPGRLLDLFLQRHIRLDRIKYFVVDEADRMLDMGFIDDVRKIVRELPRQRQSMLFSATMPPDVSRLANEILHKPKRVEATPAATTVETLSQSVYFVKSELKNNLINALFEDTDLSKVLVFTRTKSRANNLYRNISKLGVSSEVIHGNKSQAARQRALERFRAGRCRALVATDIVARGIDVDDITHVINFDLPHEPESYVHRIGRTARAGAAGSAMSFCDSTEVSRLQRIEKLIGVSLEEISDQPFHFSEIVPKTSPQPDRKHSSNGFGSKRRKSRRRSMKSSRRREYSRNSNVSDKK